MGKTSKPGKSNESSELDYLKADIRRILRSDDLSHLSSKRIRKDLEEIHKVNLSDKKRELDDLIMSVVEDMFGDSIATPTEKEESPKKEKKPMKRSREGGEEVQPKKKVPTTKPPREETPEEVSMQESEEYEEEEEEEEDDEEFFGIESSKNPGMLVRMMKVRGHRVVEVVSTADQKVEIDIEPDQDGYFHCPKEGCDKKLKSRSGMENHILNHDGKKTIHCLFPTCSSTFLGVKNMLQHLQNKHTFELDDLEKQYATQKKVKL